MSERKRTEIAELGEFGLIDSLTAGFESKCKTTLRGVGDDAAVLEFGNQQTLVTTDLLMDNLRIPSANGFSNLDRVNAGTMRNKGWEMNVSSGQFAKIGKFKMKPIQVMILMGIAGALLCS